VKNLRNTTAAISDMKISLQTKYAALKATTIALGALSIPWGTFIGYCFGEGRYFIGVVALCLQTVVALIDGYIWFWVLENMANRIEKEKREKLRTEAACTMTDQRRMANVDA
jgi:hypothetical protein